MRRVIRAVIKILVILSLVLLTWEAVADFADHPRYPIQGSLYAGYVVVASFVFLLARKKKEKG